jgi:hypothetical protein
VSFDSYEVPVPKVGPALGWLYKQTAEAKFRLRMLSGAVSGKSSGACPEATYGHLYLALLAATRCAIRNGKRLTTPAADRPDVPEEVRGCLSDG